MRLTVLGATGSVGKSTLDLVGRTPERFEIVALTAQSNAQELADLARLHKAKLAVIGDESRLGELREALAGTGIRTAGGASALVEAALEPADCVMAAIVGAAGLRPTFAAASQGSRVALANKECLVSAGHVFTSAVARSGAELLPVDSEHSAAFQALAGADPDSIEKIVLTASGGPFRNWTHEQIATATPEQALKHPNWSMGAKITIDSASLMNKGLELIEAFHLFPVSVDALDCIVHPQSIVHCLVSYVDGSVLAQLAAPDMRTPIAVALAWPDRMIAPTEKLDLARLATLTFEPPDETRFPALRVARAAMRRGDTAPAVLNAANEIAVKAFLDRRIKFLDIAALVEDTLDAAERQGAICPAETLDDILAVDELARYLSEDKLSGY
ncbi:1-deoxy-D-xylulose 5-phosphate reductoisomerase [Hyphomicrobium facile]|uniref:1-deoxy-D-xylulose 5-phosphate reductoisomerase n=2 Tax=Hyphomicrobium facile TaxID=51670 RepID=A0A1I7NFX1_9HYPH|nr:1-deoxy-D-xylulose-5-phosphate reductoisomerase [Hyphomicrobium facile]SFV33564.1 1-deoxy-D-xylulose 5-phosphate reductoisomerase [Hyphomicrobium facile]